MSYGATGGFVAGLGAGAALAGAMPGPDEANAGRADTPVYEARDPMTYEVPAAAVPDAPSASGTPDTGGGGNGGGVD